MWPAILVVIWALFLVVFLFYWVRFMNTINPPAPQNDDFDGSKISPFWKWPYEKKDHED